MPGGEADARTLTTSGVGVTWDLSGTATATVGLANNGTIQSTDGRALETLSTPTVAQSLSITNNTGASIIGATDVMRIQKALLGGNLNLLNFGTITAQNGRGFNFQDYDGLKSQIYNSNGGIIQSTDDVIRFSRGTAIAFTGFISIVNLSTMRTTGSGTGQVLDLSDITSLGTGGTVTVNNNATGLMQAANSDAIRSAAGTTINNYGTIEAKLASGTTTNNNAIDFKGNAGGTINNFQGGSIIGAHHGITNSVATGQTTAPGIAISNDGTINGQVGSGINLDTASTTTVTISNTVHGTITGHAGTAPTGAASDGDGIDVDGLVDITNSGTIEALGVASGTGALPLPTNEAITVGGGTITNNAAGVIHSVQRAITVDDSNLGNAFAQTTITNHGTITGDNGEAISIHSAFDDVITNDGTITGSVSVTSVTASNGNVSITNSGTITGAVTTGGGDDTIDDTGAITGAITMGGGGDVLKLGTAHVAAVDMGTGTDTISVKASAHAYLDGAVTGAETISLGAGAALDLAADVSGAAVQFSDASAQQLVLGAGALSSGNFNGSLTGLGAGDTIDVKGFGLATSASLGAGNVLMLSGGSSSVTLNLDPAQDFSAQRFHLSSDGAGGTLVTLAANSAPVSAASTANGTEDTALSGTVSATDADNDGLSYTLGTGPAHGAVTFGADGSWNYIPDQNYNGSDSFTWTASDGTASSASATVSISLAAVNDAPTLTGTQAVLAHASEDTGFTVTKAQLVQGFTDVDGNALSASTVIVDHGSASQNADGSWTISLEENYNGALTLNYSVVDGNGGSVAASLTTTVDAVNDAPALMGAKAVLAHGTEDTGFTVTKAQLLQGFTDVDGDTLSVGTLSVDHGTASQNADGGWTLALDANYNGALAISYSVVDGNGGSVAASLTTTVDAVNDAPIGINGAVTATEDTPRAFSAADFGFSDIDAGDTLAGVYIDAPSVGRLVYEGATFPAGGFISVSEMHKLTYEPPLNANGNALATLAFRVVDSSGSGTRIDETSATLTIHVTAVNDAPVIDSNAGGASAALSLAENATAVTMVHAADVDTGTTLTYTVSGTDAALFAIDAGTGALSFKSAPNFEAPTDAGRNNVYDITVTASDGLLSDTQALAITVTDVLEANIVTGTGGKDTLTGTSGVDNLLGLAGSDTLSGLAGNDLLDGGTGNDKMAGGLGDDIYVVDAAGDKIGENANEGTDTVQTALAKYTLGKNVENLTFTDSAAHKGTGNELDNHLTGGSTADLLDGRAGADVLEGGSGSDTYYVDNTGDAIVELAGGGSDSVISTVSYTLSAEVENLLLKNGKTAFNAVGNASDNMLTGNGNANTISGLGGNDTLYGGKGNDTLTGGGGADSFVFDTKPSAKSNLDTVTDFVSHTDSLVFDLTVYKAFSAAGGIAEGAFWAGAGVSAAHDADDRFIYNTTTGALWYDADGNGTGKIAEVAVLAGHPGLVFGDILITA